MAIFVSVHKRLNFFDMQFVNGRYETDDPRQIRILSSREAKASNVVRLDNPKAPPASIRQEVKEEVKEAKEETAVVSDRKPEKPNRSSNGQFAKKK